MTNINKKIVGYSDVMSLRPLEKISFMISCDAEVKSINSRVVKLIQGDCNPKGPGFKEEEISSYKIKKLKADDTRIDDQKITDLITVNGVRFSLEDGSWGLVRASSNKPSLVVVTESPTSDIRKKKIFEFIDNLLKKTGKVGDYDQKI